MHTNDNEPFGHRVWAEIQLAAIAIGHSYAPDMLCAFALESAIVRRGDVLYLAVSVGICGACVLLALLWPVDRRRP